MREIKFRAWDFGKKDNSAYTERMSDPFYVYSDFVVFENDAIMTPMLRDIDRGDNNKNRFKLMQYTGLKDKNGVEIYEGDIVEWVSEDNEKFNHEIIFKDCCYCAKSAYGNISQIGGTMGSGKNIYIEVIGNIYENGE